MSCTIWDDGLPSVSLGNEYYHQQGHMQVWCEETVGNGHWTGDRPRIINEMQGSMWTINSAFGLITFTFVEEKYLTLFLLRWV